MSSPYGLASVPSCMACRLRSDGFFCALPLSSLRILEEIKFSNLLPKGSILFLSGERAAGVHLLCEGRVKLSMPTEQGRNILVKVAGPGEALGVHSCIQRLPHELSAETLQPCQVAFLKRMDFLRLLQRGANVCWRTAQVLSRASFKAHEMARAVGLRHSACERIARLLLELANTGQHGGAAAPTDVALTGREIAECMGMSRVTVRRTLAAFRQRQVASLDGQSLAIHDRAALERIASAGDRRAAAAGQLQSPGFWGRLQPLRRPGPVSTSAPK